MQIGLAGRPPKPGRAGVFDRSKTGGHRDGLDARRIQRGRDAHRARLDVHACLDSPGIHDRPVRITCPGRGSRPRLSLEITNQNITFVKQLPRGLKFHLPESCPVDVGFPSQVKTISGLEYLARKGVL